jgi:hypothetical protein
MAPWRRPRWFGWWYLSIGAGFVLLAASRMVRGDFGWPVWLRVAIAAGFFALGWFELRSRRG